MTAYHFVEGLKIHEGGRADANAVGLRGAVADDVVAEDAFGRFDGMIDFASGRLQDFADLAKDWSVRDFLDRLQANQARLAHLFHANHVAVIGVAFRAGGDIELILLVGGVGLRLAQVPPYPAGAKNGAGGAEGDAVGGTEDADVASPSDPDAVAGEEIDIILDAAFEVLAEALNVFFEAVVRLVLQTADVQSMSPEPNKVARDTLQLGEDGADYPSARRRFGTEKLLDGFAVAETVAHRGNVIHAVDVRSELLVGPVLGNFFNATMKIADDALGSPNTFAVEFEFDAQHAMSGGVLRAHVDDKLVGAEKCAVFLCRVFLLQSISHVSTVLLAALNAEIFPDPSRVLPKNVVILAQWMALPLLGKQNALQVGVTGKSDTEHVEDFALQPVGGGPEFHETGGALRFGDGNFEAQARVVGEGIKNGDQVETLIAARPVDGGVVLEKIEFFFVAGIAGDIGELGEVDDQIRLLAVFEGIEDSSAKALAVTLGQVILERDLDGRRRFGRWRSGLRCAWRSRRGSIFGRGGLRGRSGGSLRFGTFGRLGRLGLVCHETLGPFSCKSVPAEQRRVSVKQPH